MFMPSACARTNEPFRVFWDEKVLSVPVFGKLMTLEIITRFIRTLSSLVVQRRHGAAGASAVARQVVENRTIEHVVDDIFSSVQQGNGISPVLYKSKYFPCWWPTWCPPAKKPARSPKCLTKMADYYDAEVVGAIRDLLTMMEPLLDRRHGGHRRLHHRRPDASHVPDVQFGQLILPFFHSADCPGSKNLIS